MSVSREILWPFAYSALIAVCSALSCAALTPFAAPARLIHVIFLSLPLAVCAAGLYVSAGVGPAATLLLSAAVCAQLLFTGSAILTTPHHDETAEKVISPSSALVFALGLIVLLGGFTSHLTTATLVALAVCALVSLNLLQSQTIAPSTSSLPAKRHPAMLMPVAVIVGLLPCAIICFVSGRLFTSAGDALPFLRPEALLIVLAAPALLAPALAAVVRRSSAGDLSGALAITTGVTTLAVGILLPALVITDFALASSHQDTAHLAGLPPISWRLDSPLLITSGFALLGLRAGFLQADRWIGLLLSLLYIGYLLTSAVLRLGM